MKQQPMTKPVKGAGGRRLAAIDIGSNSIRCIVVETGPSSAFRILDDEKATVRLGEGLSSTGRISVQAQQRARDALLRMKKITEGLGVEVVETIATSAIRRASNGKAFIEAIREDCGLDIRVISGEEEGELALESALHQFSLESGRNIVFDIGGGSVEIVCAAGQHVEETASLELGAVVMTERFFSEDPIPDSEFKALRRHVRSELKKVFGGQAASSWVIVGSGGTVTTVGGMVMAMRNEQYDSLKGYEVLRSEVVHLLTMLRRKSIAERSQLAGLGSDRADIIVAGVVLVDELMRRFGANVLRINDRGIREGLILKCLVKHGLLDSPEPYRDWRGSVQSLARSCHQEGAHGETVARLALNLFDGLAQETTLLPRDRELLEAAALLHDIGYFISYAQHHKHSYHLIRHAELFGFTPREREIIANLARYHRKSLPKKAHDNFKRLLPEDRDRTRQLAGMLRLADGLDRRRGGAVQRLECRVQSDQLTVFLYGEGDFSVEVHGGQVKSDLLASAFDRRLDLQVAT